MRLWHHVVSAAGARLRRRASRPSPLGWLIALPLLMAAALLAWAADGDNLGQIHAKAGEHLEECVGCHGPTGGGDTSSDPAVQSPHARHLTNPLLGFTCGTCHGSGVDLEQRSAAALRAQVSRAVCVTCHGTSRCPERPDPTTGDPTCVQCHEDWAAKMRATAGSLVQVEKIVPEDCAKCHGSTALYVTPQGAPAVPAQ